MRQFFADPWRQSQVVYMLVIDGAGVDTIITEAVGSRRFDVTITGPGGHSWSDYGTANPIVLSAQVIERLSRLTLSHEPKTTLNVGVITGGTSVNAIPESASMRIDMRSTDPARLAKLEQQLRTAVEEVVRAAGPSSGIQSSIRMIGERPAAELVADSFLLEVLRTVDALLGIDAHLCAASTDANIPLSLGLQAVSIGAGGGGGSAHTLHEWFDPGGREIGLRRILLTLLTLAGHIE